LDLPFYLEDVSIYAITYVRNPIDRFISHYFYHRNDRSNVAPHAKELTLKDYIDYALVQGGQQGYINGQTCYLTDFLDKPGLSYIRKLIDNGRLLLFPIDTFDLSCLLLEELHARHFKDCSYIRLNVSKRDQVVTEADRSNISRFVERDFELYQIAQEFLSSRIKNFFSEEKKLREKLRNFHKRCERRRMKNQFQSFLYPIYQSAREMLKI
jgi:hypothetical protein